MKPSMKRYIARMTMNEDGVYERRREEMFPETRYKREREDYLGYWQEHRNPMIKDPYEPAYEPPESRRIGFFANHDKDGENKTDGYEKHKEVYGSSEPKNAMKFSQMTAEKWVRSMQNEDGSKGPHWSMEQVRHLMEQKNIDCDPWEFYAILNSIYSDYGKVLKKYGVGDRIDFYIDLAKAWLEDKDAVEDKASEYFRCIVKH